MSIIYREREKERTLVPDDLENVCVFGLKLGFVLWSGRFNFKDREPKIIFILFFEKKKKCRFK